MAPVFICARGELRERWGEAFPAARALAALSDAALLTPAPASLWLDLAHLDADPQHSAVRAAVALGHPVVALSAVPDDAEAFALLQCGVQGYCHVAAAATQLREVALVVEHGGLWMPPELMQRFFAVSLRVLPPPPPAVPALDGLTARELMVAEQVARGASNREIADALAIAERTVKAHLSVIFTKLNVRDRVQLALAMNNIPTHSTIN